MKLVEHTHISFINVFYMFTQDFQQKKKVRLKHLCGHFDNECKLSSLVWLSTPVTEFADSNGQQVNLMFLSAACHFVLFSYKYVYFVHDISKVI